MKLGKISITIRIINVTIIADSVPPGVVNCVTVDRENVESVGTMLCHSSDIKKISFTGSTAVGKWLMRESATTVKKV